MHTQAGQHGNGAKSFVFRNKPSRSRESCSCRSVPWFQNRRTLEMRRWYADGRGLEFVIVPFTTRTATRTHTQVYTDMCIYRYIYLCVRVRTKFSRRETPSDTCTVSKMFPCRMSARERHRPCEKYKERERV